MENIDKIIDLIETRIMVYKAELEKMRLTESQRAARVAVVEELEFILDKVNSENGGD